MHIDSCTMYQSACSSCSFNWIYFMGEQDNTGGIEENMKEYKNGASAVRKGNLTDNQIISLKPLFEKSENLWRPSVASSLVLACKDLGLLAIETYEKL